ncbi:unnamed protein product [Bubo scandiacus]
MKELMQWYKEQKKTPQKMRLPDPGAGEGGAGQAPHLGRNDVEGDGEGDGVRGHARAVLRPAEHLRAQRAALRGQPLHIQRGFRGPRVLLGRSHPHALRLQAALPRPLPPAPREPRDGQHEPDLRLRGEVKAKYTAQMFALFSEVFEWLPLAQCINGKVLIMHGGLFSEDGVTLDDIRKIERNRQPPDSGPMCDLLWSDPQPQNGRSRIRSHEVKPEGYEVAHDGKCVTVFSAPNYCDQMGNKGSYIHLRGSDLRPDFHQFTAVPHPQRQAHDVRQHPAAAGHDVTPPPEFVQMMTAK